MEEITAATLEQPAGATSLQERLPDEVMDSPALFRWRMTILSTQIVDKSMDKP